MNYRKIYDAIIERGRNRQLDGYKERHHILPRCLGGTDDSENLVELTPEEHFVCHQLLVKIYPENSKLIYAARMMTVSNDQIQRTNKLYGWLKRIFSKTHSESQMGRIPWNKGLTGVTTAWNKGLNIIHSEESNNKRSETMKGKAPNNKGKPWSEERRAAYKKPTAPPWNKGIKMKKRNQI